MAEAARLDSWTPGNEVPEQSDLHHGKPMPEDELTGVLSSSMPSVAEVAASIRSIHRLPISFPLGSADSAFLSPEPALV
jgi:hypothetical protein